jgi:hypothetical protein
VRKLARCRPATRGPFNGSAWTIQQVTNDVSIVAINEFPIRNLAPYVIVVDELFEQADGDKLGWYAPARERPVRIGSHSLRSRLASIERFSQRSILISAGNCPG